ncbi:IS1595 family transposase [Paenibacillus sp.]|uniref:IS1595 family transposase n=1 Tax=Paenibacillus sp. TaxID=58172 RepID=UPI002D6C709B|nr:IS1595 family transposase [Paenibacillus sp.]HZG86595.1 IS1595 family transposase [Paenibacillus sp.]
MIAQSAAYELFFHRRWPNGFECPRCAHNGCYTITTRRLPLYECRLCRHQTTLIAGTVLERSRTPLDKWAKAIEYLSSINGVTAADLAAKVQVTVKSAWLMLRRIRIAIGKLEAERPFYGQIKAGLDGLGPYYFLPSQRFKRERVILIGASFHPTTNIPTAITLQFVSEEHLDGKRLNRSGLNYYSHRLARDGNKPILLNTRDMVRNPFLRYVFIDVKRWLNGIFKGPRSGSLQTYLNEYAFRWNLLVDKSPALDEWYRLCLSPK